MRRHQTAVIRHVNRIKAFGAMRRMLLYDRFASMEEDAWGVADAIATRKIYRG